LARRNRVPLPYASVEELHRARSFDAPDAPSYLRKFIHHYNEGMSVLCCAQDFYDITIAFLGKCRDDNVRYVEIMFDPQPHILRGIPFGEFFGGMEAARQAATRDYGVESNWILSINRDRELNTAFEMLDLAEPFRDRISGFGLDSIEEGNPPEKFVKLYDRA